MRLVQRGDECIAIKRLPYFFLDVVKHIAFTLISDKVFFFSLVSIFCGIYEIIVLLLSRLCCTSVCSRCSVQFMCASAERKIEFQGKKKKSHT